MSSKLNEGIVNWILQKAIALVAGGDYRKAVKAFTRKIFCALRHSR